MAFNTGDPLASVDVLNNVVHSHMPKKGGEGVKLILPLI